MGRVVQECRGCSDQLTVCYDGQYKQTVTVSRTDTWPRPFEPGGWGQNVRLRCIGMSIYPFLPTPVEVPPGPAREIILTDKTENTVNIRYDLSTTAIGTCECPVAQVQVKAEGTSYPVEWKDLEGDCSLGVRECTANYLYPDAFYYARIRLTCSNDLTAPWKETVDAITTDPGCAFSVHSGRWYEFECVNGDFVHMSDDN